MTVRIPAQWLCTITDDFQRLLKEDLGLFPYQRSFTTDHGDTIRATLVWVDTHDGKRPVLDLEINPGD